MSNYPNGYDDDATLPVVNDNLSEIGGDAINALRDAVVSIEQALGTNIAGTSGTLAARLGVFINPDGTPNSSVLTSLGLVTLPITNSQIINNAGISESKLHLDYRTGDLFNYIRDLSKDVNLALGWINVSGIKLEPHLIGALYRHDLAQIDVAETAVQFLNNKFRALRDNTDAYTLVNDINSELLAHQWADGSPFGDGYNITSNNGSLFSAYYAHTASGVYINPTRFNNIPQTANDLQLFAEYIDTSSILLLGTRIQNLYSAGISRVSRSSSLNTDGYGQPLIPPTAAIAYLKDTGSNSAPFDDINAGDDIIQFTPPLNDGYAFDEKFALVKVGDIIRINYGTIEVPFLIKEKRYSYNGGNKIFIIRIAGKNLAYSALATARVDRPLFNNNKYGELSISPVNNQFGGTPSLIINNPRGAQALGLGFDPAQFDESHYFLYLALFPTGNPSDGYVFLPPIDVTGNRGTTPGLYTLESVVQAANTSFRTVGYNYRFTAFSYQGEFGVCLADSYGNAGFSIVNVALTPSGAIDSISTALNFPNNAIDLQPTVGDVAPDPLGMGPLGSGVSSPPFYSPYGSSAASQSPTRLFVPLRRNNYYVNGSETERLNIESTQALDGYGDGYWVATIQNLQIQSGRVETTYRIPLDLSASNLKAGKTVVIQSLGNGSLVNFGRFIIESVSLSCASIDNGFTDVTVYDSVHAVGFSPTVTLPIGSTVAMYFCADSVSFNAESATDLHTYTPFKRHFEVYVDDNGNTFTHERGRFNISGATLTVNTVPLAGGPGLAKWDVVKISPKLRGYQFGSVNKITLSVFNYSDSSGVYDGYLCSSYDGTSLTHFGPTITGRKGEITRFYDETNTDYIDVIVDVNTVVSDFTNQLMDFQLFPTLALDDELMQLGTCQVNDQLHQVTRIVDTRQFGNISEKDLSSSVFDFMSGPERYLHSNGVIRGFDISNVFGGAQGIIDISGGVALVDGKLLNINNESVFIPVVREFYSGVYYPINWAMCINSSGEYQLIPLLDYDAVLGTPFASTRVVNLVDPTSGTSYKVPGLTFSDLVNSRKDLALLYVVGSTVMVGSPNIIAITATDTRRYVYKKDWGERPTLAAGTANGEFRDFTPLAQWFNLNSNYTSSVNVKGTFTDIGTATLGYNFPVIFYGDGQTTFSPSAQLKTSNITFHNFQFNHTFTLEFDSSTVFNSTINSSGSGAIKSNSGTAFNNCTFNITTSISVEFTSSTFNNCTFNFNSSDNVTFSGCNVNNCTLNFNSNGGVFQALNNGSVISNFYKSIIYFGGVLNTVNVTGNFIGNSLTWAVPSLPLSVTGTIQFFENTFSALGGSFTTGFLLFTNSIAANGLVSRNFFYRNSNNLTGYIVSTGTPSGVVSFVDNFFDSTTADGTNQNLINGLPLAWPYVNNLNTPPTVVFRPVSGGGTYNVVYNDYIIGLSLTANMAINLPSISLSPPGRILIIKDVGGTSDTYTITLHRASGIETIEGIASDYVWQSPFGALTLVSTSSGWTIV